MTRGHHNPQTWPILLAVAIWFALVGWLIMQANENDDRLLYVGDCVDITADREGHTGTPKQQWEAFAQHCADRYESR